MRLNMWALIVAGLWTAVAMAQKECSVDADCMDSQWCYNVSKTCVNYTICSRYNREESSQHARQASQCGKCFKGYVAELTLGPNGEEADICRKSESNETTGAERNNSSIWVISGILFALVVVLPIIWAIHAIIRCKFPRQDGPAADTEKPSLLMVENGHGAFAPSAPSATESMNNNKYSDAEETNPLSTTRECRGNFAVESSRPVKAQGFHPPYNVRTDPTYNPSDNNQMVQPFSPPDDEETNPSDWTPGPLTGGTVPAQPFSGITEEARDNSLNSAAIQRLACPSPSTSQDGQQQARQDNGSPGNSGFGYNNANDNAQHNSNSSQFFIRQTFNIVNQGSNGS